MTMPAKLSQGVIVPSEEPGPPAPVGLGWARWDRLAALLNLARSMEVVDVPEAIEDRYLDALGDRKDGKPAPSLGPIKRELVRLREEVCWTLRVMGHAQARIAHSVGVSQAAVSKLLRRVERRVLARMESEVRSAKARQAAQIEYLYDQVVRAWKQSQETIEERSGTTTDIVGREKCVRRTMTRRGPGDPRFLMAALQALAAERELWGLDRQATPDADPTATIQATRIESVTVRHPAPRGQLGIGRAD